MYFLASVQEISILSLVFSVRFKIVNCECLGKEFTFLKNFGKFETL